ncbi:CHAT domain-containing protein [Actinomadura sp. WMMB 499]|uniref:CHAT domain-containing protein n=1 Tax=Actinomadura sp. WMMB 499 TaxID=1219491 RepID=UPI0012468F71|nr:CHAT domain-containing protein [Actinomadura sp. WMMB 499]QFG22996.1 CHAT domain-containing protein [Actinomadura sp. WMMB 499]
MTLRNHLAADSGRPPPETAVRRYGADAPDVRDAAGDSAPGERTASWSAQNVKIDDVLPPDIALLCVKSNTGNGLRGFELHFHYRTPVRSAVEPDDLGKQQAYERLSLGRLRRDGDDDWKGLFDWLEEWSGAQNALNRWLGELLANERAQLIVFDVTSYEVPWELFYYRPPPYRETGPEGWLGALVPVARWTSLPYDDHEWHLGAQPRQVTGGLLMMEDASMGTDVDSYVRYEVAARERTLVSLLRLLQGEETADLAFSLLLIHCHGELAERNRVLLDGTDLASIKGPWPALLRNRAIVLLNACISGRSVTDSDDRIGAPARSCAQKFLGRGAGGVIATLGDVHLDHAREFAVNFVARAEGRDQNLAEYLREYRAEIAEFMRTALCEPDALKPVDYKMFFWSFMYVYYGHPLTTLRLHPKDAP